VAQLGAVLHESGAIDRKPTTLGRGETDVR
jgi:hypothetical protein